MQKLDSSNISDDCLGGNDSGTLEVIKLNYRKRTSEPFIHNFEVGNINYDTPISYFLKTYYKKDLSCYVVHEEIFLNDPKDKHYIFILKDDILLTNKYEDENNNEFFNYTTVNPIYLKIEYKQIYSIDIEVSSSNRNLIFRIIKSDNFTLFTNVVVSFQTIRDLYLIFHLIEKHKILAWQSFYEYKVPINPPFYYQNHFFLQKVNKRGKPQSRVIVLTNKFLLNVIFEINIKDNINFKIESQKWALSFESIKSMTWAKKKPLNIKLSIDKSINKKIVEANKMKLKNKKEREFLFYYEQDLSNFIFQCRKLFFTVKKSHLPVTMN